VTIDQLAQRLRLPLGYVASLVDQLEHDGLVRRDSNLVHLSAHGERQFGGALRGLPDVPNLDRVAERLKETP
jgi:DNA-binding IclR family transcriptional regulator